jgi:hypothetical protein
VRHSDASDPNFFLSAAEPVALSRSFISASVKATARQASPRFGCAADDHQRRQPRNFFGGCNYCCMGCKYSCKAFGIVLAMENVPGEVAGHGRRAACAPTSILVRHHHGDGGLRVVHVERSLRRVAISVTVKQRAGTQPHIV